MPEPEVQFITNDALHALQEAAHTLCHGATALIDPGLGTIYIKHDQRQQDLGKGWVGYQSTAALYTVWPELNGVV